MNRSITRRDFMGGVAVAISGSLAWRWSEAQAPTDGLSYPSAPVCVAATKGPTRLPTECATVAVGIVRKTPSEYYDLRALWAVG